MGLYGTPFSTSFEIITGHRADGRKRKKRKKNK